MKLVPNMDQHNFLLKRMQLVGGNETQYDGLESDVDYDMNALGDMELYPLFYEWNGARYMDFPQFNFDDNHIPIGDSVRMCLGLSWAPMKKRN